MGTENVEHPMQPLIVDDSGVVRFKRNAIIDRLFHERAIDLRLDTVPIEDVEQFWQLLGYSVSGYSDLSFIRPETRREVRRDGGRSDEA